LSYKISYEESQPPMSLARRQQLASQLEETQAALTTLFQAVAGQQDWQPGPETWSFRYQAAHLATAEREAFRERVFRIAGGEQPHFAYYLNSDRDFSQAELLDSLQQWAETRREILDFVRALPAEALGLTGTHETQGVITVLEVLQVMVDHDREHLQELTGMVKVVKGEAGN
jgi:hypothetical protein